MNIRDVMLPVVALAVGGVLGYCLKPSRAEESEQVVLEQSQSQAAEPAQDNGKSALRARIKELEAQLVEKKDAVENGSDAEPVGAPGPRRDDWRERIENFRRDNPEEFARVEKRRQEFRRHRADRARSKLEFLAAVDVSRMTDEQKDVHRRLQALVARREELESQISPEAMMNSTEVERREFFEEMHEISRDMRDLNGKERETLLQQAAQAIGYEGDDAAELVSAIKEIYENTGDEHGFRMPGGRRRNSGGRN